MHILMLVLIGLVFLAGFWFGARLMGRTPGQGAALFIWAWLAASLLNAVVGVVHAGIPVINEIRRADPDLRRSGGLGLVSGLSARSLVPMPVTLRCSRAH